MSARPTRRHPLVAAGGLLAAVRGACARVRRRFGGRLALRGLRVARLRLGRLGPLLLLAMVGRARLVLVPAQRLTRAVRERQRRDVVDVVAARRRVPSIGGDYPRSVVDYHFGPLPPPRGFGTDG